MTTTTADKGEQEFKREERYYVIKLSDFHRLNLGQQRAIEGVLKDLTYLRERAGKQTLECVVVESDWPEYEPVWKMIEDRMAGRPTNEGQDGLTAARKQVSSIIEALAEIVKLGDQSKSDSDPEVILRPPVMVQVVRIREAASAIARHLSSKQATRPGNAVMYDPNDVAFPKGFMPVDDVQDHSERHLKMVKADAVKMPDLKPHAYAVIVEGRFHSVHRHFTDAKSEGFDAVEGHANARFDILPLAPIEQMAAHTAEAVRELVDGLRHAADWINSEPHGDNCFLGDELSGDRCWCGKDSFVEATDAILAKYAPSQEGGNRG